MSTTINNDSTGEDLDPNDFFVDSGYRKIIVSGPGFWCVNCDAPIRYGAHAAESPDKLLYRCERHFIEFASYQGYDDQTWDEATTSSEPWWSAR